MILADNLSRAYPPAEATAQFSGELAALATVHADQMTEILIVKSPEQISRIIAAGQNDDITIAIKCTIGARETCAHHQQLQSKEPLMPYMTLERP
jgi:hypothetical protein